MNKNISFKISLSATQRDPHRFVHFCGCGGEEELGGESKVSE
jgi:hypothetical protein